jgi:N-acetylneuraminate synthase
MGASIIEKHFTLNRDGGGPDDSFSMEPSDLYELCNKSLTAWSALGGISYGIQSSDKENLKFRRSLYFNKALKAGDIIGADSIRSVRPGYGIPPKYFDEILGKKLLRDVDFATPVTWSCIK